MHGERRVVTILLCDVAETTALVERFALEIRTEIMNDCFMIFIPKSGTKKGP
jgi:hypothetical protein